MWHRVEQFFRGVFAQGPNEQERKLIQSLLSKEGQELFYGMNVADQRHSLNVLSTAQRLVEQGADAHLPGCHGEGQRIVDRQLLYRCCLLHDVGRGSFMGPFRKSIAVLLNKCFPIWSRWHGRWPSRSYVRNLLHRYYHHQEISSDMLQRQGFSEEASIVVLHHKKGYGHLSEDCRRILVLMRQADSQN